MKKSMEKGNNKCFWKYIKAKRKDNIGIAGIKERGILHQDNKVKANLLNKQFKSVFTKENPDEPMPTMPQKNYPSITDINISVEGVEKLLRNVNIGKACGPDNIPNFILKTCASELAPAITEIFQLSLDTGTLPEDWRNANISPVFKKGNRHIASNYRPISLTCVCCKLLEHIICRHILDYLELQGILSSLRNTVSVVAIHAKVN